MSEKPTANDPSQRHAVMARVDKLCDHFERAWKAGQRPDIAKYLSQASPVEQSVLLRELIALDIDYRNRQGQQAAPADYSDRFPKHRFEIEAAFARHKNDESLAETTGGLPTAKQRQRGPYRVLREYAKGGVGQISIARDESLKRHVALKELLGSAAKNPAGRNRFIREAKVTAQLSHPGVVPVYAFGMDRDGCPYYTMRLVEGQTLKEGFAQYHESRSKARLRELLRRFVMVCQTIGYAHARGIVHRDLKPANIMLGEFGETLVLDWGVAKPIADGGSSQSTLGDVAQQQLIDQPDVTRPGAIVGTPSYMPPEQALGMSAEAGPAADIYGLGAVLYELLCGRPAFAGSSSSDVINKVRSIPPEPPSKLCTGVARPLEAICLKAISRDPKSRYATATALVDDVQHWLDDEAVSAYEEPWPERACRWTRHHRTATVSGALVLFCLLIASLVGVVALSRERASTVAAQQLAEDQAQKAEEATALAKEKEADAQRWATEARDWSEKAKQAMEDALTYTQEANALQKRKTELETDLAANKAEAAEAERIKSELELARDQLLVLEERIAEKTEEALSAREQAQQAHEQFARFQTEADQLRDLARTLAALASGQQPEPKVAEAKTAMEDFTEDSIANFDVTATDGAFSLVTFDTSQKQAGTGSIRIDTLTEQAAYVTYPARRNANWDLSDKKHLTLSLFSGSAKPRELADFWIRIGRGSNHIEFRPEAELVDQARSQWLAVSIPLAGGNGWRRSDINQPDLSHVDWIEVHAKPTTSGATLWVDDFGFRTATVPDFAISPFNANAAKRFQQNWANYLGVPIERTINLPGEVKLTLVLIPPGEFLMGSPDTERDRFQSEGPQHHVKITRPFYIGKHEVTQSQWRALVNNNPSHFENPRGPVEMVRWDDIQQFLERLNLGHAATGVRFVLPTEAQWEYACRAGTTSSRCFGDGDAMLSEYAWSLANAGGKTHSVGQLKPNAWGLYDLYGNVWECCTDWFEHDYYVQSPSTDPVGPPTGSHRVTRGGGWQSGPPHIRSANRNTKGIGVPDVGFRLVALLVDKHE